MFKRLKAFFSGIFGKKVEKASKASLSDFHATLGGKDIAALKLTQSQLDKRTHFAIGESYRVGELIVTLQKDKASMLAAIAAVDARREARHKKLTKRGEDLMLMTPEQLMTDKMTKWLDSREKHTSKLAAIMGAFSNKRYIPPRTEVPAGSVQGRFKQIMSEVKEKDKV